MMPGERDGSAQPTEDDEEGILTLAARVFGKARRLNRDISREDIRDMLKAGLTAADAFLGMEVRRKEREEKRGGPR